MMPDKERCHTGIGMLLDIAEASPVPYCIQPLAVIAYTLWCWAIREQWCSPCDACCSMRIVRWRR